MIWLSYIAGALAFVCAIGYAADQKFSLALIWSAVASINGAIVLTKLLQ